MSKKTYRVTGDFEVAGAKKGETFTYEYTEDQERALLEGGLIEHARSTSTKKKPEEGDK